MSATIAVTPALSPAAVRQRTADNYYVLAIDRATANVAAHVHTNGYDPNLIIDIQGGVSGGAHNVAGTPHFVDVLLDDYHLGPGSAAADAGVSAGVVRGLDGDLRPNGSGFD